MGQYASGKNRLLKVCLVSAEKAKDLLRKQKKDGEIRLYSDQTPSQKLHLQSLKDELKRREKNGEKLTIKYISGVPKIIELPSKN